MAKQIKKKKKLENECNDLKAMVNNIASFTWLKDLDSNYVKVNKSFAKKLGYGSPKKMIEDPRPNI